ncbi:response regulator transcription factor [Shimazuella sp. AN120528]|uniref:response regulator transcription factor n=1 Tax=Shimazuella soli TaxID=1892854 RepID=UPI001F0D8583|nr:response regulator transcription factor [Shimazuella soli]MCH5585972.1 response regulator transcription factor [Shimazuella soli]
MQTKVLIADDESSITELLSYALLKEGFQVEVASDGEEAYEKMLQFQPHMAILDVMMPKMSGFEICQKINADKNVGIILITAKNDISDKVVGLELGADDYITKPFDIREVLLRVKSLLRRLSQQPSVTNNEIYRISNLVIDKTGRKVTIGGKHISITLKEFDLLVLLMEHTERVFTREELLDLVWGMDYIGGTRTVDIHIRRLRQKLGQPYDQLLQTLYGVGYKIAGLDIHHET